jgi:hypothetical protein
MNVINFPLELPREAQYKAAIISAIVVAIQIGFMLAMYFFFDARDLGRVLVYTLFVGTLVLLIRREVKLFDSYCPGFAIHPGLLWTPLLIGAVCALYYLTGGSFLGVVTATAVNGFLAYCDAFDFARESRRNAEVYPASSILLLFILAGPQIAIALTAMAALMYGI